MFQCNQEQRSNPKNNRMRQYAVSGPQSTSGTGEAAATRRVLAMWRQAKKKATPPRSRVDKKVSQTRHVGADHYLRRLYKIVPEEE
mmetsp:Transcript_36304/g.77316  ORF Transcript_36304/g.77316 Transcript_36304/m.77316 type:complete len:86 (-) Transcript_36304:83-340(-)